MADLLSESARRAMERSVELRARSQVVLAEAQRTLDLRDRGLLGAGELRRLTDEVAGLRRAMESRAVIEQAKGILMGSTGCGPDRAFEYLVRQSQHENRKVAEIAADLVESKTQPSPSRGPERRGAPAVS